MLSHLRWPSWRWCDRVDMSCACFCGFEQIAGVIGDSAVLTAAVNAELAVLWRATLAASTIHSSQSH